MAINDIYQIRVHQLHIDEEILNVFYYRVTAGASNTAEDLYTEFTDLVWDIVRTAQSDNCRTNRFEVINGMDNDDYFYQDVASFGSYSTGLEVPPNVCFDFRAPSGGPASRYGYKKIAGVMTGTLDGAGSGKVSSTWLAGYGEQVGSALGLALEGAGGSYVPAIITGEFILGTPPTFQRAVQGQWSVNEYWANQRTRQKYSWVLPEPA